MCGIAGFIDTRGASRDQMRETVEAMTSALFHRGPDDAGVWIDQRAGVALGHRRLSILDLSPLGRQPMFSPSGRYALSFNGEIYNYQDLKQMLVQEGFAFRGNSDTEVLAAAIDEWGPTETAVYCNGMFAIAIWDARDRVLHLLRDRLGEKPLYYGLAGSAFVFASELKAIRTHPGFEGAINSQALAEYFRRGYIPAPLSVHDGIFKLPPGTHLRFNPRAARTLPEPRAYWSMKQVAERASDSRFKGSEQEAVEGLNELLLDAVRIRMHSDVPLGAMLSGGIDSSSVVAMMQAQASSPVKTFSIGFESATYNESQHAAAVANHLGTDHTELIVEPNDALKIIPQLTNIYDEPFSDSSQIPTYLVCSLARRHVTVALSGDGGDEAFGGYDRYRWACALERMRRRLPEPIRRAGSAVLMSASGTGFLDRGSAVQKLLSGKLRIRNASDKAERFASILRPRNAAEMYSALTALWPDPAEVLSSTAGIPNERTSFIDAFSLTEQMMYADTISYLPDDILTKVDRASMHVALEGRIPLLDHRVFEFSWSLPAALRIQPALSKSLLRKVLYRYVPERLVSRPKMGFAVPLESWLRGELRPWAESLLSVSALSGTELLNTSRIRKKWQDHLSGTRDYSHQLWSVLVLQDWMRRQRGERTGAQTYGNEALVYAGPTLASAS